jgi:hypothetical protein
MSPADVERFEAVAGGLLDELGYERARRPLSAGLRSHADRVRRSFASELRERRHRRLPSSWQDGAMPEPAGDADEAGAG